MSGVIAVADSRESTQCELVAEINKNHERGQEHQRLAIECFVCAGEGLLRQKKRVEYGHWGEFIKENFGFSQRTANDYMYLAKHWKEMGADSRRAANLRGQSLRQVIKFLRKLDSKRTRADARMNRGELLKRLNLVKPGLATKVMMEQTGHFIFRNGCVETFNGEVHCLMPCELGFEGAVDSRPLLKMLDLLPKNAIPDTRLGETAKQLTIDSIDSHYEIDINDIHNPCLGAIKTVDAWQPLPDGFWKAIKQVSRCASTEQSRYVLTCIHFHPDYLEACDQLHGARISFKMGFKEKAVVQADAIRSFVNLELDQYSIATTIENGEECKWLRFKNASGLTCSARLWPDPYPEDVSRCFTIDESSVKVEFSQAAFKAIERATIPASLNPQGCYVRIQIQKGRARISSNCDGQTYQQKIDVKYDGKRLSFMVVPRRFLGLLRHNRCCTVSESGLIVDVDDVRFWVSRTSS